MKTSHVRCVIVTGLVALAFNTSIGSAALAEDAPSDCHVGAYRLADGMVVDLAMSESTTLRWRKPDGTTGVLNPGSGLAGTSTMGWTDRPDGHHVTLPDCASNEIVFDGATAHRIAFDVTETTFVNAGTTLAGRLVLPQGNGAVPIVVLLHGSENDSAIESNSLQRRLPAEGIGVFVFDKRGTGRSQGKYTQDFQLLADDAVAAMTEARRLSGARLKRIGYQGPSQGGWIAPIAATKAPVDFIIVGFGLAVSPLEEDRSAVVLNMTMGHFGSDVIPKALEVADASGDVVTRGTDADYRRFDEIRERYRNEPWFSAIKGNFTFFVLNIPSQEIREKRSAFEFGTPWHYDPLATIARVKPPQLWILADDDIDAPSAETARRLDGLRAQGRPITTVVYPLTEHGIYEYETKADGTRISTRQPRGYLDLMIDFARGVPLKASYGDAFIASPSRSAR
jgi:uncharacterized protein